MSSPGGPPLSRVAYDRAALHRSDDAWLADAWNRARVVLISPGSATPIAADGRLALRPSGEAPDGPRRLLGLVDGVPHFAVTCEPDGTSDADDSSEAGDDSSEAGDDSSVAGGDSPEAGGTAWKTLREVGPRIDDLDAALVVSAIALEQWHQRHTHCPMCGAPTVETQSGWTRTCTADASQHFPRTDPAVIMLIHDGGDLALMGRGPQWGEGRFSTLAGFVEPGESLEAAVAREVFEEVGVGITDIRYVASQPWPFPASLMLGFVARLDGDPSITLDPVEMAEAGWFSRDEISRAADWTDDLQTPLDGADTIRLRAIPPRFSISRYLIDEWLAGRI